MPKQNKTQPPLPPFVIVLEHCKLSHIKTDYSGISQNYHTSSHNHFLTDSGLWETDLSHI